MSLLADLFAHDTLDPGYAEAAAHSRRDHAARVDARRKITTGGGRAGVFGMLALAGLLVAVAGLQVRQHEPAAGEERRRLIAEIRDRTTETDELQRRMETVRGQAEQARAAALARSAAGLRTRQDLARAADAAAATARNGPGISVTVEDARRDPAAQDGAAEAGRVYDQDLQILVNGLWGAGAIAIAVNGQRLTSTTAIRAAGDAILVDYRPLSPPYEVTALGGTRLDETFGDSPAGRHFRTLRDQFGIRFDVHSERAVRLPAAAALRLRYAREEAARR